MQQTNRFKENHSFEQRKSSVERVLSKYKNTVPVIVQKADNCELPDIEKKKYLVSCDFTVGAFLFLIRTKMKLDPKDALFFLVNNTLPPTSAMMSDIYEKHADLDGFIYFFYVQTNTFGN